MGHSLLYVTAGLEALRNTPHQVTYAPFSNLLGRYVKSSQEKSQSHLGTDK